MRTVSLPSWLSEYIGIPYKNCGRSRDGMDCWGLVKAVQKEVYDREVPSYNGYEDSEDKEVISRKIINEELSDRWKEVSVENASEGDVVIMRLLGSPCHAGIWLEDGWILHIRRGSKSCIQDINSDFDTINIRGVYRWHKTV